MVARKKKSQLLVTLFASGILLGCLFSFYLWNLYGQLNSAFTQQAEFIPTRIYSDVIRIKPPQTRSFIEDQLKRLGYTYQSNTESIQLTLHSLDYPLYLLPDNHPTLPLIDKPITLTFSGPEKSAQLSSLEVGNLIIPDFYLEPELIATLSQSGESKKEIRTLLKFDEIPSLFFLDLNEIADYLGKFLK